jgi:hypothetical protein
VRDDVTNVEGVGGGARAGIWLLEANGDDDEEDMVRERGERCTATGGPDAVRLSSLRSCQSFKLKLKLPQMWAIEDHRSEPYQIATYQRGLESIERLTHKLSLDLNQDLLFRLIGVTSIYGSEFSHGLQGLSIVFSASLLFEFSHALNR